MAMVPKVDAMHEFSIARALLRQVSAIAEGRPDSSVTAVHVTVGEFSGIEGDLLEIAFRQLSPESVVSGARLDVRRVPLQAECEECRSLFDVQGFRFVCPECASRRVRILRGEELMLDGITFREGDG